MDRQTEKVRGERGGEGSETSLASAARVLSSFSFLVRAFFLGETSSGSRRGAAGCSPWGGLARTQLVHAQTFHEKPLNVYTRYAGRPHEYINFKQHFFFFKRSDTIWTNGKRRYRDPPPPPPRPGGFFNRSVNRIEKRTSLEIWTENERNSFELINRWDEDRWNFSKRKEECVILENGEENRRDKFTNEMEKRVGKGGWWNFEFGRREWSGRRKGEGRICEWRTHVPLDRRSRRRGKLRRREISSILYIMRGIIRLVEREIAPRLSLDPPPPVPGFLYSKNRFLSSPSSHPRKANSIEKMESSNGNVKD